MATSTLLRSLSKIHLSAVATAFPRRQYNLLSSLNATKQCKILAQQLNVGSLGVLKYSTLNSRVKTQPMPRLGTFASGVRWMPTLNQIRRQKPRTKNMAIKKFVPPSEKVMLGPQRKGVCVKVFIRKPKKPNSAQRKCALLKLSNGKTISAYIPGERGQLQEHGVVIFEGGRVQDCPGIKYKIIRGKLDMN